MTHQEKQAFRAKLKKEGFSYKQIEEKLKKELNSVEDEELSTDDWLDTQTRDIIKSN